MKIVLLAAASAIHTIRWANGLRRVGHDVHLITQHAPVEPLDYGVIVHKMPFMGQLGYVTMVASVKKLLKTIQPDVVNAHYASGYGTTARLARYHPLVLSAWGSDVFEFPYKSWFHARLLRKNLYAADVVASTSQCMADQIRRVAPQVGDIPITPFGVNISDFAQIRPLSVTTDKVVIGTVKTMAEIYGIDILIHAFALLLVKFQREHPDLARRLWLRLVGGGPQTDALSKLAKKLGVKDRVQFVGRVAHKKVPEELEKLDIYVALSRRESFGVAVIEAGAARRPVIVSNTGGLPEVTLDGQTGIIVPSDDAQAAALAIEELVLNADMRLKMGEAGYVHVSKQYSWSGSVETMVNVFENAIRNPKRHC